MIPHNHASPETESPNVRHLLAGDNVEDSQYSVVRSNGTRDWLLIYTLAGAGQFGSESHSYKVWPGTAVIIQPGTSHEYRTAGDEWHLLWVHFHPKPDWRNFMTWHQNRPGHLVAHLTEPVVRRRVQGRFTEMIRISRGILKRREVFAMNALEEILLWLESQTVSGDYNLDDRITDAMEYMCQNLGTQITISELAQTAGLSPSRFGHLFKTQVGTSPIQYLEKQRLDRAQQLLQWTSLPIQEVAQATGYVDAFYFSTLFKSRLGRSPTAYREQHIEESPLSSQ